MNILRKSLLVVFALLAFGQTAWAQDEWPKTWISGTTTCTLTEDGVFTVLPTNGLTGAMADVDATDSNSRIPWYSDYCSITAVVIGPGVTHVGDASFMGLYSLFNCNEPQLQSVTFSDDVESIGDFAFASCPLQAIIIPDNVITIGQQAFAGCSYATTIHIGDGVTTLGVGAFEGCKAEHLYIGQSVTTVLEDCFEWSCYETTYIECHAMPFTTWTSSDQDFCFYTSSDGYVNRGVVHLPFANYSAWAAAYPNSGCVFLPDLDTEIHWTSGDCELNLDGFGTLTISCNGAMEDYATPADCTWNYADIISKVNRVVVEQGVTTLSNNGFTGFTNVADVVFLCDVLENWSSCATDFANTTTCYVNYSWTNHYTNALAAFHFNCGYGLDWTLETNGTLTISKTLPGSGLFYDYQNASELPWYGHTSEISDVVLGDGVLDIGSYVFSGINAATISIAESVTHINSHAFDGSPIVTFTVPESVTQIDAYAFANSGLYSFEIPSFLTEIPEGLFKGCSDLTQVTFAQGTTSIGKDAFLNTHLTEVNLPTTLTTIGEAAFANTAFAEITFPASLTNLGLNAFSGCTDVTDVYCKILDPNSLTWTSSETDFNQSTQFHVVTGTLSQWQTKFPNALVNFVEDMYDGESQFEIYTSSDWLTFCNMVRNVSTNISAKLMADINVVNWSNQDYTVGTANKKYAGTFDGNGHTLTFSGNLEGSAFPLAPFLYVEGAIIKNLHTAGTLKTGYIDNTTWAIPHDVYGAQFCSGLVSRASGTCVILNCQVSVTLDIYHNRYGDPDHCGGFVGEISSGASVVIMDCLYDGTIQYLESQQQYAMPKPTECGGFVGCNKGVVTFYNSLFSPANITFTGTTDNFTFSCNKDGGTMYLFNCFYTRTLGVAQGTDAASYSTWWLSAELGDDWTLNSNLKPVPVMTEYTLEGEGTIDNPYLIGNANDWAYLARMVNSDEEVFTNTYFKMTDDINTSIPVGIASPSKPFRGIFNGDGHTLNVAINYSDNYAAPFGYISGATIEGLKVTGTVNGGDHSAGLVGTVAANYDHNYISNCKVSTTITTTGDYAGGIMGHGSSSVNSIIGCLFDGSISKTSGTGQYAGALMGWCNNKDNQEVESCFVTGNLNNFEHKAMNYHNGSPKYFGGTNCYHTLDPDYYHEAPHAYSITSGTQGMTFTVRDVTNYNNVSGIDYYDHGMSVDGVLYGNNESFSLNISAPQGFTISEVQANGVPVTSGLYGYAVPVGTADVVVTATLSLNGDPIHEINTVQDWNLFARTVSNGCHNYSGETVNLNADLSIAEMVGASEANSFQGTFEGNGHTLTFNANTSEQLCAPFRWIKDAIIQNLHTTGTINTSNQMAAGIVGRAVDGGSLIGCSSNMEIISSKNGSGNHGGIVAEVAHENNDETNISVFTFEGCLFDGKLISTNGTTNCGGFVGYAYSNRVQFWNCLFNPVEVTASMGAATFGQGANSNAYLIYDNAYYFTAFGTAQSKQARSINPDENVSVEFDGRNTVYAASGIVGYVAGLMYDNVCYAGNSEAVSLNLSCTPPAGYACHHYEVNAGTLSGNNNPYSLIMPDQDVTVTLITVEDWEGDGSEETPYLIYTNDQWELLANRVNSTYSLTQNSYSGKHFKLMNDITVSTMVGTNDSKAFSGIFDGNGNTLTFTYNAIEDYTAPFRYVDGATVKNLVVEGTITTANQFAAGLMGHVKGTTAITNCRSSITINSSVNGDGTHGGFVGNIEGGTTTIEGCVFDGSFLGSNTNAWGGFVGWTDNRWANSTITILNSMFAPDPANINISTNDCSTFTRYYTNYNPNYITITNCYYTQTLGTAQGKLAHSIIGDEYVTVAPAGNVSEYNVSGITTNGTGIEYSEVLYADDEETVSLTLNCDAPIGYALDYYTSSTGTLNGTENPFTLTMEDADVVIGAELNVPDWTGEGTEDIPYIILYYTQLDLLAQRVNDGNSYNGVYFKLGADIEYDPNMLTIDNDNDGVNESNYTAIGTSDRYFRGHFDGDNHTISGIRVVKTNGYQGLFGRCANGGVKNLVLDDTDITGSSYTGGIVGRNSCIVSNCHVTSSVTIRADHTGVMYHGGVVGFNDSGTITRCTSSATLTIENGNSDCESYGGLVGFNRVGTVTDNFVIGATIPRSSNYYGCVYGENGTGTLERNYYNSCTMESTVYNDINTNNGSVRGYLLTLDEFVTSSAAVFTIPTHGVTPEVTYNVASYGTIITLGNTLPAGYIFDHYTVRGEAIQGNTFTMPNYNVTVGIVSDIDVSTLSRSITGYGNGNGGWNLIASPVGTVNLENVTNMFSNTYDLYRFNQSANKEWENYKALDENNQPLHPDFTSLEVGRGYLYANSQDVTLVFSGTPYNGNGQVTLSLTNEGEGLDFPGMNLVGNPFNQIAYLADNRDFYTMNSDGTEIVPVDSDAKHIEAMEGIFVIANTDGETLTFTTTEPENNSKSLSLNLSRGRGLIDRAIIRFGEGLQLPKFQLNQNSSKVYIPQHGTDYAVVRSHDIGELPVCFKANENGAYTISVNPESVEFSYLHLVDNMTGTDVDLLPLLREPGGLKQPATYTFEAKTTDYENRFKLVFVCGDANDGKGSFAFFSNGNWIIANDGEATLQVIDLNGRILSSETVNGSVSKAINAASGVYMLRLINENDVKTQKIVVR